jgi:hypothetical protein
MLMRIARGRRVGFASAQWRIKPTDPPLFAGRTRMGHPPSPRLRRGEPGRAQAAPNVALEIVLARSGKARGAPSAAHEILAGILRTIVGTTVTAMLTKADEVRDESGNGF